MTTERKPKVKAGYNPLCPHCGARNEWGYEWGIYQGDRVGWWKCYRCGEYSQDHDPVMSVNPMLRHNNGKGISL